ncbi:hypothetical protein ABH927_006839, partial [Planotetraspora sp. GP83]
YCPQGAAPVSRPVRERTRPASTDQTPGSTPQPHRPTASTPTSRSSRRDLPPVPDAKRNGVEKNHSIRSWILWLRPAKTRSGRQDLNLRPLDVQWVTWFKCSPTAGAPQFEPCRPLVDSAIHVERGAGPRDDGCGRSARRTDRRGARAGHERVQPTHLGGRRLLRPRRDMHRPPAAGPMRGDRPSPPPGPGRRIRPSSHRRPTVRVPSVRAPRRNGTAPRSRLPPPTADGFSTTGEGCSGCDTTRSRRAGGSPRDAGLTASRMGAERIAGAAWERLRRGDGHRTRR